MDDAKNVKVFCLLICLLTSPHLLSLRVIKAGIDLHSLY